MRSGFVAVVTAAVLAVTGGLAPAAQGKEGDPTVVVTDKPGAPREMLLQLEKLTGRPQGTLDRVVAVDTGGARLTPGQIEAIAAGKDADGVKVLGEMKGGEKLLDTTLADLSDGSFDGRGEADYYRSAVIFDLFVPGYEWCLTICVSTGRSVSECIQLSRR